MKRWSRRLGGVTLLMASGFAGCGPGEAVSERTTPEEIRGIWVSSDPSYLEAGFEVLRDALIFHTLEGGEDIYVITAIRSEVTPDGTEFEIDHRGREAGSLTLSFIFRPAESTIVFKNQPQMVWMRDSS